MRSLIWVSALGLLVCAGCSDDTPTRPSAPPTTTTTVPSYPSMIGSWVGTNTIVGLGTSLVCTLSMVITDQASGSGNFSGTIQQSGTTGCATAARIDGTVTPAGHVTLSGTTTVSNGSVCTDANRTQSGVLSGRTMTVQITLTRTCTSPPPTTTFNLSQSFNLTKQ